MALAAEIDARPRFVFIGSWRSLKSAGVGRERVTSGGKNLTRKYIALNHQLRGSALAELGKTDNAIAAIEAAVALADTIQYQPIRWSGRYQLAELYSQMGYEQEAHQSSSKARDIIHAIADSIRDEPLRKTFLNAALQK